MNVTIARLITQCQIPRRLHAMGQLVDQIARERFAGECIRQLTPHWTAHPSVIRIRRLRVGLRLASDQLDSEHVARAWAAAFAKTLLVALAQPTGTGSAEVVRAENRAAWLATVISDLLSGTAAQHWEYEEFREYFGLGTAAAVLALLSQEPSEAVPTLSELAARGTLDRLLAVCDDLALEQLFGVIAYGCGGANESRLSMKDVLTVGQLVLSGAASLGGAGLGSRQQALRLFLALIHGPGLQGSDRWSPRRVFHALTALVVLVECSRLDELSRWGPALAADAPVERLSRSLSAVVLGILAAGAPVERLGRSLPAAVVAVLEEVSTLVQQQARLHRSAGTTTPFLTELVEVLQGLRSLVSSSTVSWNAGAGARWISSDCAGLFLLVGLLARWGWPGSLLRSSLEALHGPRAITYGLAGLGLALLGRVIEMPNQLDPGLALFAGWLDGPDLAGLRRFFASGSAAERRELLGKLVGEVASHEALIENWPATFNHLAEHVIREFAGRVRGFRRASRGFVVKHVLALPGRIRVEDERLCVFLGASPFHVALHLSGMDEAVEAVSWLGGRRVEFQLEGL